MRALLLSAVFLVTPAYAQVVVPNASAPIAAVLIDPANGKTYKVGQADVVTKLPVANIAAPTGVTLINPTTGVPYH